MKKEMKFWLFNNYFVFLKLNASFVDFTISADWDNISLET